MSKAQLWMGMLFISMVLGVSGLYAQLINYQGKLAEDNTVVNAKKKMTFTLYDNSTPEANNLWEETHLNVPVEQGAFQVALGSQTPFGKSFFSQHTKLWLAIKVENDVLSPRFPFTSVPFAAYAETANRLTTTGKGGDSSAVFVDSEGNVGIGTDQPQANFDLRGTTFRLGNLTYHIGGSMTDKPIISSDGVHTNITPAKDDSGRVRIRDGNSQGALNISNAGLSFIQSFSNVDTKRPSTLILQPKGGDVGSDHSLVVGPAKGGRHLIVNDIPTARWGFATGDHHLSFQNDWNNQWTTRMVITEVGNIGIGTTPASTNKLEIAGVTLTKGLRLPHSFEPDTNYIGSSGNFISFAHQGISEDFIGYKNNAFYFKDSRDGADIIDPSIKWGKAGELLPDQGSSIELGGQGSPYLDFKNDLISDYDIRLQLINDNTLNLDGGNFEVKGDINANNFPASSDQRFKKNIFPLDNVLKKVLKLKGVQYHWKTRQFPRKNFSRDKQIGVIAQEVEPYYPELVFTDAQGYKSVDYSKFTPILIEAIKEQQQLIEHLTQENRQQQQAIRQLKQTMQNSEARLLQTVSGLKTKLATLETAFQKVEALLAERETVKFSRRQ